MKKFFPLLLFTCWVVIGFAQSPSPTRWKQHVDSIFQHINRSPVNTGILTNYGYALKDYNQFQGTTLTTNNQLQSLLEWRLLYAALQTSIFNSNSTLPSLDSANQRIMRVRRQQPGTVSIATLMARYNRYSDDAGTAGLVTVNNQQLYDNPNRSRSPYEQRTLAAMCPLQNVINTRTPQFLLPSQLFFANAITIQMREFDAGDGQGYRSIAWNQAIGASYSNDGTYTLRLRLTTTDGTVLLSQANIMVKQVLSTSQASKSSGTTSQNNKQFTTNYYGNNGILTRNSTDLFTDTRPYNGIAATGTITVAYATGNNTGTIRNPLIVIEGYDPSHALDDSKSNYSITDFLADQYFGGTSINYDDPLTGTRVNFNDQLSQQYDLIFLDYQNGTDYIQRNAYLAERLIQWVNENKQPLNGVKQQNIVIGMSMGGLVARYALRDMEVRRAANPNLPAHDTRLYISHEAPHQGANVPLGIQYMVKSVAAIVFLPGLTLGKLNPELGNFAGLLNEPASQQLLIYQTDPNAAAVHQAWLNEYNQLGYPQQCRNVATSDGSECGRPQLFAAGSVLVNIQGTGMLGAYYNALINSGIFAFSSITAFTALAAGSLLGPAAFIVLYTTGLIFALGNYEGHVDFIANALADRQAIRIYHGRASIYKDILFGLFTTRLLIYADDNNSSANMLAYDTAPGGLYDINQVSNGAINKIKNAIPIAGTTVTVQPLFTFVPTTSALDIGGGRVALGAQDLTASYINTAPPAAPRNTPFANFITEGRENQTHILWTGLNAKWVLQEMQGSPRNVNCLSFCQANPSISGPNGVCASGATYSIANLPSGTQVKWELNGTVPATYGSTTDPTFNIQFTGSGYGGSAILTATLISECGTSLVVSTRITFGSPQYPTSDEFDRADICYGVAHIRITNYDPGLTYTVRGYRATAIYDNDGTLRLKVGGNQTNASYTITASNNCGTITSDQTTVDFTCDNGYSYATYPNPGNDAVTVEQQNGAAPQSQRAQPSATSSTSPAARTSSAQPTALAETASFLPFAVRLYDMYGKLWLEQPALAPLLQLRTANLPVGPYIVQVLVAGVVVKRIPLSIQH